MRRLETAATVLLVKRKPLKIGKVTIAGREPVFILGPCVIESEKFVWRMARRIAEICRSESVPFIFKASYDKANRTSIRSYRGIGVREGCEILAAIGAELRVPVTTDVHSPAEAEIAGRDHRYPANPGVSLPANRSCSGPRLKPDAL